MWTRQQEYGKCGSFRADLKRHLQAALTIQAGFNGISADQVGCTDNIVLTEACSAISWESCMPIDSLC